MFFPSKPRDAETKLKGMTTKMVPCDDILSLGSTWDLDMPQVKRKLRICAGAQRGQHFWCLAFKRLFRRARSITPPTPPYPEKSVVHRRREDARKQVLQNALKQRHVLRDEFWNVGALYCIDDDVGLFFLAQKRGLVRLEARKLGNSKKHH